MLIALPLRTMTLGVAFTPTKTDFVLAAYASGPRTGSNNQIRLWLSSSSSSIPQPWGSLGHLRWFHVQFLPFFSRLHCPLGLGELQACPFPDVVFPPLLLFASSCPSFHWALQDGFGQSWWTGDVHTSTVSWCLGNGSALKLKKKKKKFDQSNERICSLRLFTMVRRSSRGPIARWILARTSSLVPWSLYEMRIPTYVKTLLSICLRVIYTLLSITYGAWVSCHVITYRYTVNPKFP